MAEALRTIFHDLSRPVLILVGSASEYKGLLSLVGFVVLCILVAIEYIRRVPEIKNR